VRDGSEGYYKTISVVAKADAVLRNSSPAKGGSEDRSLLSRPSPQRLPSPLAVLAKELPTPM